MPRSRPKHKAVEAGVGRYVKPTPEDEAFIAAEVQAGRLIAVEAKGGYVLYVPYGEGHAVPLDVEYAGLEPFNWSMRVQFIDDQPRCVRLVLEAPPGGYITAETARVPLGRLVEEVLVMSAVELDANGTPIGESIGERVTSVPEARKLYEKVEREHRRRRRGTRREGRVTDEILQEVARVYRASVGTGRPAAAVHEHFKYRGRSTVGRWIAMARERGYLGSAPGRGILGETENERTKGGT